MKKLKLNLANMQGTEVLTREQLKKIVGGTSGSASRCVSDGVQCGPTLPDGKFYTCSREPVEGSEYPHCCCGNSEYDKDCDEAG